MTISARSHSISFFAELVVAEALAVLQASEFSHHDLGLPDIILKGDLLQVINVINTTRQNWSRYGQIVVDINVVIQGFRSWQICHTKQMNNYVAHERASK